MERTTTTMQIVECRRIEGGAVVPMMQMTQEEGFDVANRLPGMHVAYSSEITAMRANKDIDKMLRDLNGIVTGDIGEEHSGPCILREDGDRVPFRPGCCGYTDWESLPDEKQQVILEKYKIIPYAKKGWETKGKEGNEGVRMSVRDERGINYSACKPNPYGWVVLLPDAPQASVKKESTQEEHITAEEPLLLLQEANEDATRQDILKISLMLPLLRSKAPQESAPAQPEEAESVGELKERVKVLEDGMKALKSRVENLEKQLEKTRSEVRGDDDLDLS